MGFGFPSSAAERLQLKCIEVNRRRLFAGNGLAIFGFFGIAQTMVIR